MATQKQQAQEHFEKLQKDYAMTRKPAYGQNFLHCDTIKGELSISEIDFVPVNGKIEGYIYARFVNDPHSMPRIVFYSLVSSNKKPIDAVMQLDSFLYDIQTPANIARIHAEFQAKIAACG